ncbi:MAG: TrmH family RNA methyltransferase [Angustibacter sp.]
MEQPAVADGHRNQAVNHQAIDRSSLSNPRSDRVRSLRQLHRGAARRRTGRFLVEGPQAVRAALQAHAAGRARVLEVLLTPQGWLAESDLPQLPGVRQTVITPEVLAELALTVQPQGWLAVAEQVSISADALLSGLDFTRPVRLAILAQVRDPGNAGTLIRAADATGCAGVIFSTSSVSVHNPKCVRATAGSLFHLPLAEEADLTWVLSALRAKGVSVLAAAGSGSTDLDALLDDAHDDPRALLSGPTAWVFGNEAWGLPEEIQQAVDAVVRVPMHGQAESLNLAMAATVCLQSSARAQTTPTRRAAQGLHRIES